eukprot:13793363-Alexandrium_andersonii.AAC.1
MPLPLAHGQSQSGTSTRSYSHGGRRHAEMIESVSPSRLPLPLAHGQSRSGTGTRPSGNGGGWEDGIAAP